MERAFCCWTTNRTVERLRACEVVAAPVVLAWMDIYEALHTTKSIRPRSSLRQQSITSTTPNSRSRPPCIIASLHSEKHSNFATSSRPSLPLDLYFQLVRNPIIIPRRLRLLSPRSPRHIVLHVNTATFKLCFLPYARCTNGFSPAGSLFRARLVD